MSSSIELGLGVSPVLPAGEPGTPWSPDKLGLRAWYDAELGQPKGVGYVQLDGTSGDYIYTPDAINVDQTGDLELVMRVYCNDWSNGANQTIASKYVTTGNQRSWRLFTNNAGVLSIVASGDGTAGTLATAAITPLVALPDATWIWLRARLQLSNGVNSVGTLDTAADTGSNSVLPVSWTANGSATGIALASCFSSTSPVEIGSFATGTLERFAGKVGRCIVRDGFDGRTVADFNASDCYGPGYLNQGSLPTDGGGARYVPLRGVSGDYVWTADKAALRITGDIEIAADIAPDSWSSGAAQAIAGKWTAAPNLAYQFRLGATGTLVLVVSTSGAGGGAVLTWTSSASVGLSAGTRRWVKAALDVDNGASASVARFYTSTDGSTWTQLGSDVVGAVASIFGSSAILELGSENAGASNKFAGRVYRAIVRSGIAGTTVADFNAEQATVFGQPADGYGNGWLIADPKHLGNWTLGLPKIYDRSGNGVAPATFGAGSNQPQWLPWQGRPQLYSPAGTNNTVSAPSLAQYNITGDIEIVARVMQVPNGASMRVVSRTTATTWGLFINASNLFGASVRIGGVHYYPSVSFGQWFGRPVWVRWTRVAATGENAFYVHPDQAAEPTNWILLGTSTTGGAGAMDSVAGLGVIVGGYAATGGEPWQGTISKVTVRNGIAGSAVADFDAGLCGQAGYSSAEGSVWTVNRATSGPKVVVQSPVAASARSIILHGTDDYITLPSAAVPPMGVSDNASVTAVMREWATPTSFGIWWSTQLNTNASAGVYVANNGTTLVPYASQRDAGANVVSVGVLAAAQNLGARLAHTLRISGRGAAASDVYINNVGPQNLAPDTTAVGDASASTPAPRIGSTVAGGNYLDAEFEAWLSANRSIAPTEHGQLTAYYKGGL